MTGGQIAPTTLHDSKTSTSPYGNPEQPFDISKLVAAAGATYVAKWTTNHVIELTKSMKEAMQNPGFSFIEVLSQCPTQQRNILGVRAPAQELPSKLLDMLAESTFIADREERKSYIYTVLAGEPEASLMAVEKALGDTGKAQLVDHLTLGRVARVDADDIQAAKMKLSIPEVKRIADSREGKQEIGVFVRKQRTEYTEALREVGRRARGE